MESVTPVDEEVESLAQALCDTYYLTVNMAPEWQMWDAWLKITEKTREHWRAQAVLLIEKGWRQRDNFNDFANRAQERTRSKPRRW